MSATLCKIKDITVGEERPRVCVPLTGTTAEEMKKQADLIRSACLRGVTIDLLEIRADFLKQPENTDEIAGIMEMLREMFPEKGLLFTLRSREEGGRIPQAEIPPILTRVIDAKLADAVDIEMSLGDDRCRSLIGAAHGAGIAALLSNHDFDATPATPEIVERLRHMQELGADIAKFAAMPETKQDVLRLMEATVIMHEKYARIPIVTMSMGKLGAMTRITGEITGSAITFASVGEGSAPGQLPIEMLASALDFMSEYKG